MPQIADNPADNPADKIVTKVGDNPADNRVSNPADKIVTKVGDENVDNRVSNSVDDPGGDAGSEIVASRVDDPADEIVARTVAEVGDKSVDNPVANRVRNFVDNSVDDPGGDAGSEVVASRVDDRVRNFGDNRVDSSVDDPGGDAGNEIVASRVDDAADEVVARTVAEVGDKGVDNPVAKSVAKGSDLPFELTSRPRESAVADIARQLLSQLLSGRIAPGTRLPSERRLAESLQVGRSTIREALKALDVLGIIEVRQGDGTYLRQSTSDLLPQAIEWGLMLGQPQVLDLIEARRHIEMSIAELAAERASTEDLAALRSRLEGMRLATDAAAFVEADVAFHLALAKAAGNTVLNDILVSIRSLLRVWIRRAINEAGETRTTVEEHAAVFEAVLARSPQRATEAMRAHLDQAAKRLLDSLETRTEEVG